MKIKKTLLLSLVFLFSFSSPAFAEIDLDIQTMNASKAATRATTVAIMITETI